MTGSNVLGAGLFCYRECHRDRKLKDYAEDTEGAEFAEKKGDLAMRQGAIHFGAAEGGVERGE